MKNPMVVYKQYSLLFVILLCNIYITGQPNDSTVHLDNNNSFLTMEATISIFSVNNFAIYKPFTLINYNIISVNIMTGVNFGFENPFNLESFFSNDRRRVLEYDFLIRSDLYIYKSLSFGIESGITYKYIASNRVYSGRKWNEKVGLIFSYNMTDTWSLIFRTSGTFEKVSTFGIGAQFRF